MAALRGNRGPGCATCSPSPWSDMVRDYLSCKGAILVEERGHSPPSSNISWRPGNLSLPYVLSTWPAIPRNVAPFYVLCTWPTIPRNLSLLDVLCTWPAIPRNLSFSTLFVDGGVA